MVPPAAMGPHEWKICELAQALDMPTVRLYNWLGRGWGTARREEEPPLRWIIAVDANELARLRQCRGRSLGRRHIVDG